MLEDQFEAQRTELEASNKKADKYHQWLKEERRRSHSLAVENKELKAPWVWNCVQYTLSSVNFGSP